MGAAEPPLDAEALIRENYDALNRGDVETLLEHADPEIEFASILARVEGGVIRGHDGIRDYMKTMSDSWDDAHWDVESVQQIDEHRALAVSRFTARGKGSGVKVEQEVAAIFTERDGKAIRVEGYPTVAEARAAAGLD